MMPDYAESQFQYWMVLLVASIVNLIALRTSFEDGPSSDWSSSQKWVISLASISIAMSALAGILHIHLKEKFAGTKLEFLWIKIVLILWCIGLPTLMDAGEKDLYPTPLPGEAHDVTFTNANIFFSAWAAFIAITLLFTSHCRVLFCRQNHNTWFHWWGFAVAGLVVFATSLRLWNTNEGNGNVVGCESISQSDTCSYLMFGTILGFMSFLFGFILALQRDVSDADVAGSFVFFTVWSTASAYLTFADGPGSLLGVLYFGTWFSVLISLQILSMSLHKYTKARAEYLQERSERLEAKRTKDEEEDEKDKDVGVEAPLDA